MLKSWCWQRNIGAVLHKVKDPTADGYLCGCYSTAIFMLSLPILATTIEPDCAAKDVVPLMAVETSELS